MVRRATGRLGGASSALLLLLGQEAAEGVLALRNKLLPGALLGYLTLHLLQKLARLALHPQFVLAVGLAIPRLLGGLHRPLLLNLRG